MRRVATTYARRGTRVLLLAPPGREPGHENTGRPAQEMLAAWMAAAQLLARLGRPAHVRTLAGLPRSANAAPPDASGESGPRLVPTPLEVTGAHRPEHRPGQTDHHTDRSGPSVPPTGDPDRYPLVLAHLHPHGSDWALTVPWARLLTPHGTLAAIAHSDTARERSSDTIHLLTHITGHGELALVDRIALVAAPASAAHPAAGPQAHTELLILAPPHRADAAGTGKGGER